MARPPSGDRRNIYLNDVHGFGDPDRRQIRRLAAPKFIFTMVLTVANLSRLNKLLADRAAGIGKPASPRVRDVNGDSASHPVAGRD